MDFDIGNFIAGLTLLELVVALIVIEVLEVVSGLLRAWKNNIPIKGAITRESIVKKFEGWKYIFGLMAIFIYVGQLELAKALLGFVLLPEIVSFVENFKKSITGEVEKWQV